jgi:hypothetical protein
LNNVYTAWLVAAAVLVFVAGILGIGRGGWFGVLIDSRGRYSLTQLQLVLWTLVAVPLIAGVFWGRLLDGHPQDALSFSIPANLLLVIGISAGSAAVSTATKAYKDGTAGSSVSVSVPGSSNKSERPFFAQVFLLEEGAMADRAVDIAKFQQFWITLILVAAYIALAIGDFGNLGEASRIGALPDFSQQMVILLGISHVGYLAGKLPAQAGVPPISVQTRDTPAPAGSPADSTPAVGAAPDAGS